MSIQHIQWLQRVYISSLAVTVICLLILLLAVTEIYKIPARASNVMTIMWLVAIVLSVGLSVVIRKVRCPVCRHIFVGRTTPMVFTHTCRNCGRRAGDTG